MKHISLLAIVMAFSINSSAKSILCASKDHSLIVSVSTEDQVNSQGYLQANSLMIQKNLVDSKLVETKEIIGGVDLETNSATFLARAKGPGAADGISALQLDINDYREGKDILLKGLLKIDTQEEGKFVTEETHQMSCITDLKVGV